MLVTLFGAAREVTGSCYYVESGKAKILVDCGLFQGTTLAHSKNFEPFGFDASQLDAVLVTHAHLDHTGRLPVLIKNGFKGKIFLTPPTAKLTQLVLEDAAEIMEDEFQRSYTPKLFSSEDVAGIVSRCETIEDHATFKVKDLKVTFHNAGHIFGSSFVVVDEGRSKIVFSGDLGNVSTPLLPPKDALTTANALFIESTYGNRIHEDESTRAELLKKSVVETISKKGVLLIPAFAIERTQEILFELNHFVENKLIPPVDVYLDSPMAIKASAIFDEFPKYYNRAALRLIAMGDELFEFPGLKKTLTRDESKTINEAPRPKVIIAGSGMMNGGRILHHLVRYLSDKNSTLLIIGFQAEGTLGRRLYTGERHVNVLSETIDVKAKVTSIGAYSAHADQRMLLDWIKTAAELPKRIFCTHGEEAAAAALATRIKDELDITAEVPRFNETIKI
ncbi:MAG: MBL fold metallo-hydrolase [Patescibacteria group bacterium]|nr:MBL fold metallo-hydrolase [Patescibacteria group bacterium]